MIACGGYSQNDTICIPRSTAIDLYNDRVTGALCDTQRAVLLQRVDLLEQERGEVLHQVDALKYDRKLAEVQQDECRATVKDLTRQNLRERLKTRIVAAAAVVAEIGTVYLLVR